MSRLLSRTTPIYLLYSIHESTTGPYQKMLVKVLLEMEKKLSLPIQKGKQMESKAGGQRIDTFCHAWIDMIDN